MKNKQITIRGLLHTYIDYKALIEAQAKTPAFKSTVKKRVISSRSIQYSKRKQHILKLTNKSCNKREK